MSPADLLIAWLHDPPDKALDIRGHEPRARRYLEAALGRAVTENEQKSLADSLASAIERLPMAKGDDAARRVGVEDGLEIIHPLSAQHADPPAGAAVDEEFVVSAIREIVGPWPDVPERFLALWRLLPERLADRRPYFALLPADTRTPDHTIWQHMDATAALAAGEWGGNAAFLSFSLGPVQSFIAAARSLRDLWTGSMILSWLTFEGMLPVIEKLGPMALVYPALRGNPFLDRWLRDERKLTTIREPSVEKRRSPCLPNRFVAVVPWGAEGATARELAAQCDRAARAAWARLCAKVHKQLAAEVEKRIDIALRRDWDFRWDEQVKNYFDFRVAVLPWKECDDGTLADLLRGKKVGEAHKAFAEAFPDAEAVRGLADTIPPELRAGRDDQRPSGQWQYRLELSAKLLESLKSVRHFPPPTVAQEGDRVPPKCSLLASFEQMGPAELRNSAEFWEEVAKLVRVDGVRIRPGERFSAVALVKRFAGPAFFRKKLGLEGGDLRWADTATLAAAPWLTAAGIKPGEVRERHGRWSGQWLHWATCDQDEDKGEEPCPDDVWRAIKSARQKQGPAPAYYAVLMLDGDDLGGWLRGERSPRVREVMHEKMRKWFEAHGNEKLVAAGLDARRPVGPALHASIGAALSNFALHFVPRIVDGHSGQLIYAGGDDVLALLPTSTALACARKLCRTYRQEWGEADDGQRLLMGRHATLSAGLAVVHYKEDLRFALGQARQAEQAAKRAGRDSLQIAVCRRSGEHASALCPWTFAPTVESWVEAFLPNDKQPGASDRWAYHLRAELDTLEALPFEAMRAEIKRQISRAEEITKRSFPPDVVADAFDDYRRTSKVAPPSAVADAAALRHFITLIQSASFLARGRDV